MVLAYFITRQGKAVISQEIQAATGLQQPEVSVNLKTLSLLNWVLVGTAPREKGKIGPAVKNYQLIDTGKLFQEIEQEVNMKIGTMKETMEKLRSAMIRAPTAPGEHEASQPH
jgi:predicted transcriptional regulator